MCGRFTLTLDSKQLQESLPWLNIPEASVKPRYNVAPTQPVAVVPNDGRNRLDYYMWGLIPSWAKDPEIGSRLINARAETLAEKPAFRSAFRRRRCLILADGFYEWQQAPGRKTKIPTYIQLKTKDPFAFAGLWESWHSPDGSEILSCTIITTEPNSIMKPIHNRMPVILHETDYKLWLSPDEKTPEQISPLLKPFPSEKMITYPVSTIVNSPANETPECISPVAAN